MADNLTVRQLEGRLRHGDSPSTSLILLQVSPSSKPARDSTEAGDDFRVFAKRFCLECAISMLTSGETFDITPYATQEREFYAIQEMDFIPMRIHGQYGMILHDFDSPLFQSTSETNRDRGKRHLMLLKALQLKPQLPDKIKYMILDHFLQESPIDESTDAPPSLKHDADTIEVHALFPSTDLVSITDKLKRAIRIRYPEMDVRVYAWKSNTPATRRDFLRLWHRIVNSNVGPLIIQACFLDAVSAKSCDSLILAKWCGNDPLPVRKLSLDHAVEAWTSWYGGGAGTTEDSSLADKPTDVEQIYFPDDRFFPLVRDRRQYLCVFLTNKRSAKAIEDMKQNIFEQNIIDHARAPHDFFGEPFEFRLWKGEEDGNDEEMLRMAISRYYWEGKRYRQRFVVFIDRDTFENGDVVLSRYVFIDRVLATSKVPCSLFCSYDEYHHRCQSYEDNMTYEEKVNRYKQGMTTVRMNIDRSLHRTMFVSDQSSVQFCMLKITSIGLENFCFYHQDFDKVPGLRDLQHYVRWDEVFGRVADKIHWRQFTSFEERRWAYEN